MAERDSRLCASVLSLEGTEEGSHVFGGPFKYFGTGRPYVLEEHLLPTLLFSEQALVWTRETSYFHAHPILDRPTTLSCLNPLTITNKSIK